MALGAQRPSSPQLSPGPAHSPPGRKCHLGRATWRAAGLTSGQTSWFDPPGLLAFPFSVLNLCLFVLFSGRLPVLIFFEQQAVTTV